MARITRKELKTDKFALEVEHTAEFFEEHRREILRYGAAGLVVVLLIFGYVLYSRKQHTAREAELGQAIAVQEAPAGGISGNGGLAFPTQEAKDQASLKAFTDLKSKYPGTVEGEVAEYYIGSILADQGKLAEAEKAIRKWPRMAMPSTLLWPSCRWRRSTSATAARHKGRARCEI